MTLDNILEIWEEDSKINSSELGFESLNIPSLHHKYYKIFVNERLLLRKYENELKTLKMEKYEFYTQGPSKETQEKGWNFPAIGKILKNEVSTYLESDKDIINMCLKISIQNEKIDLLGDILKTVSNRTFQIKNAIDFERFKNGN